MSHQSMLHVDPLAHRGTTPLSMLQRIFLLVGAMLVLHAVGGVEYWALHPPAIMNPLDQLAAGT